MASVKRETEETSKREDASPSEENLNATKFQRESSTCPPQTWSSLVRQKIIPNFMITCSRKDYSKILMNIYWEYLV